MESENCLGALSLLPVEMWEAILERVDDSKDVKNFCRAWKHPNWDLILHRTKASWLFDEIFPLIFPYLSSKEQVLSCRLVCKRWCRSVDQFLENNSCHRPPSPPHGNSSDMRVGPLTKSLRDKGLLHTTLSSEKIDKIMQRYSDARSTPINYRNPIISRSVYFDWSKDDATSTIVPFLSKVGHHIWDFRVEVQEDSPLQIFQRLQKYLKHLPKLKRLEIFGETTLVIEKTVQKNLQELQSYYKNDVSTLLPELLHLETLDATVFNQYRETILELLLTAYSSQLCRLNLHCFTIPVINSINLEKLTELTLSVDSDGQLEPLSSLNLPLLRRLTIYILRNSNRGSYPNFSKIFQTINLCCFAQTLRALLVEFPVTYSAIQWSQQCSLPILHLPHLKTLELKEATIHSFNFITQLASLEFMHLYKYRWNHRVGMGHHYEEHVEEEQEVLDLKKLLDNPSVSSDALYQSNLWKVLPNLIIFTLSKASTSIRATATTEYCYRRRQE